MKDTDERRVERAVVVTIEGSSSPREVAREGDAAPGGGSFGPSFDRPAITQSNFGDLIAFTNRNSSATTAYISSAGRLSRSLRTGTRTDVGTLIYNFGRTPRSASGWNLDHQWCIAGPVRSLQGQGW